MFEREVNTQGITKADIAVVIPSFKEADSIAYPTQVASEGLKKYFGKKKSVIINVDNASPDGTEDVFLGTKTEVPKIYITTPENTPGKGWNFANAFRKCHVLGVKAIVCVDADLLSLRGIAKKSKQLVGLAKSGKQASMAQGSFTISNMGMLDVENFAAIINPPESAILAVASIKKEVIVTENNDFWIRDMMKMTLSADHRIVDGTLAVKFINKIKYHLQNPKTLLG